MSKNHFHFAYIDAFAGTGYYKENDDQYKQLSLPLFGDQEKAFFDGSARIALNIEPSFEKYIFIEKDISRFGELRNLSKDFPEKKNRIKIINEEANYYLKKICMKNWLKHRAVVFLDPFGMQIKWETLKVIAETKSIDLWFLFPLGQAVNRLFRKDGKIIDSNKRRLDDIFGTKGWFDAFYNEFEEIDVINGVQKRITKTASFKTIKDFFISRLELIFEAVSKSPRVLMNSTNNPLYLLCFAVGNKKGAPTAIKIADHILKS